MTLLAFIPNAGRAEAVVAWCGILNETKADIEYVCLEKDGDRGTESAVRAALGQEQSTNCRIISIFQPTPVAELLDLCRKTRPELLVTAPFAFDTVDGSIQTSEELVRAAPCMTVCALFGDKLPSEVHSILLVVSRGAHDRTALQFANLLRKKLHVDLTLATVEDESGAKAEHAGEKAIRSLIHECGFDQDDFQIQVAVDRLPHRAILHCVDEQDLILCGADVAKHLRPLRESLRETTAVVVKRAPPLRLKSLGEWFPQINPTDHAELLQDLRQGSRWNSDFVSMLALAAAIASLGLMQNSPAVVIGSMLLAPLMTPMIGAGLGLAQANVQLAKQCAKTIALGLLLTLAVSFMLGVITPSRETLSPEVISRGSPNILDLLIALFAAVAATIAMARPNIAGAIAGVAIATALVPPICAVGLSLSLGKFSNAVGALLLFGTNLIAIIVASSFTFTLLGILTVRSLPRHRRFVRLGRWGLVIILVVLAGPLSIMLLSQLEKGRSQTALFPVTRAVARALRERVDEQSGVDLTFLGRSSAEEAVIIHIAANHDLPRSYANELRTIVRTEMDEPALPVLVVCLRGQWLSESDDLVTPNQ